MSTSLNTSDLVAAFLASGGAVKSCPPRRPAGPSIDWADYEYEQVPQPVPSIGKVRHIVAVERKRHEKVLQRMMDAATAPGM